MTWRKNNNSKIRKRKKRCVCRKLKPCLIYSDYLQSSTKERGRMYLPDLLKISYQSNLDTLLNSMIAQNLAEYFSTSWSIQSRTRMTKTCLKTTSLVSTLMSTAVKIAEMTVLKSKNLWIFR